MQECLMTTHHKTWFHYGYFLVHAVFKDVIVMQDSNWISYVSKDCHTPPTTLENNFKIQFIEFTYCNDRFSRETLIRKTERYQPLINNINNRGWNVETIVITTGARATTHIPSMKILEEKFKIPEKTIRRIFTKINTIAIEHAMSIILHKRRLKNNEPLPVDRNST